MQSRIQPYSLVRGKRNVLGDHQKVGMGMRNDVIVGTRRHSGVDKARRSSREGSWTPPPLPPLPLHSATPPLPITTTSLIRISSHVKTVQSGQNWPIPAKIFATSLWQVYLDFLLTAPRCNQTDSSSPQLHPTGGEILQLVALNSSQGPGAVVGA